jgi:hypothetical protein
LMATAIHRARSFPPIFRSIRKAFSPIFAKGVHTNFAKTPND